ncbi:MAG: insulinase family protein [Acidobacteria bacterium]|nr:insulinase family protein [Acidobacteriota bacterium]
MDVKKKELPNGLVIASEAMPHLRSASLGIWIRTGSRSEEDENSGISHFIEHLLFKGTRRRSTARIAETIDSIGGQLNAFTEKEYVGYYAKVLDRHLPVAFDLLADMVMNPAFPAEEIERERNVIYEEINMVEDSPQELVQDLFLETFWKKHPLGRPIAGSKKTVARITRPGIRKFFRRHYTASNMVVAVAGNVRHGEVFKLAERYFSDLKTGGPVDAGKIPAAGASRSVRRKPNLEQTHLCLGSVAPPIAAEERYCAHLLCNILGGGMSSRLFQNIREKLGLVYSIYSMLNQYRDAGTLVVYAGSAPDKAPEVVERTLREFSRLRQRPVSSRELSRAKEYIKGSIMLSLESSGSRMSNLAQQMIYHDRFYEPEEILDAVERVPARGIRDLANRMLDAGCLTLAALGSADGRSLKSVALDI